MKLKFQTICNAFLNFAYPPICLHCQALLKGDFKLLCSCCTDLLELIHLKDRCPCCCSAQFCPKKGICRDCIKKRPVFNGLGAAFDYIGPAATLIKKIKYSNQPYLAEGCGAFLAAQLLELSWPMPDIIVPVPIAFTHRLARGYNQSLLLSQSLGKIIDRPVCDVLARKSGDFSQAGLSKMQRMQLEGNSIFLKKPLLLEGKHILLIDDVMTTGSTMRKCAEALLEGLPAAIHGLAVCKAT